MIGGAIWPAGQSLDPPPNPTLLHYGISIRIGFQKQEAYRSTDSRPNAQIRSYSRPTPTHCAHRVRRRPDCAGKAGLPVRGRGYAHTQNSHLRADCPGGQDCRCAARREGGDDEALPYAGDRAFISNSTSRGQWERRILVCTFHRRMRQGSIFHTLKPHQLVDLLCCGSHFYSCVLAHLKTAARPNAGLKAMGAPQASPCHVHRIFHSRPGLVSLRPREVPLPGLWLDIHDFLAAKCYLVQRLVCQEVGTHQAGSARHLRRCPLCHTPSHVKATFLEQPVAEEAPAGEKEYPCLLLIGTEGFTGRLWCTGDEKVTWAKEIPVNLKVQFLAPDVAHSRFSPGTVAKILVGRGVTGQVEVLPALGA